MPWVFENPPNELVVTTSQITGREKPVFRVSHYPADGGWCFLHGESFSMESAQLVTLASL